MLNSPLESLVFYREQSNLIAGREHAADHFFTVDSRGCSGDVITAGPGYIGLRRSIVDEQSQRLICASSVPHLFLLHRKLAAEFPAEPGARYEMDAILRFAEPLITRENHIRESQEAALGAAF